MNLNEAHRTIHTNLYSEKAWKVCASVLGQLSDGWGENNLRNDRYWKFAGVRRADNGEVLIHVSTASCARSSSYYGHETINGFKDMNGDEIRNFFAKMIKKTAMMELKDREGTHGWKRNNDADPMFYLGHSSNPEYGPTINLAEVYVIYEFLLGRVISSPKFAEEFIKSAIGQPRSTEDTIKAKEYNEKKIAIKKAYDDRYDELRKTEEAELKAVKEKYKRLYDETHEEWVKQYNELGTLKI